MQESHLVAGVFHLRLTANAFFSSTAKVGTKTSRLCGKRSHCVLECHVRHVLKESWGVPK